MSKTQEVTSLTKDAAADHAIGADLDKPRARRRARDARTLWAQAQKRLSGARSRFLARHANGEQPS
jgi:hypothetical protein